MISTEFDRAHEQADRVKEHLIAGGLLKTWGDALQESAAAWFVAFFLFEEPNISLRLFHSAIPALFFLFGFSQGHGRATKNVFDGLWFAIKQSTKK